MFRFPLNQSDRALAIANETLPKIKPANVDEWANIMGWLALIATLGVVLSSVAEASEPIFYSIKRGKMVQVSKVEAMLELAQNPAQAQVLKCAEQELSEKATIRAKKARKK